MLKTPDKTMQILPKTTLSQFIVASLIFFIGLVLFTINTLHLGFGFGVEESRYILFAQEMQRFGFTPFPLLYGQPYPDYPATHTFLIYLSSLLFHQVTPFTAILPSAIASALTLAFTYRIAAVHSNRWGLYAILFLLGTYEFILLARLPSPDPLVAAVTVISFYFVSSQPVSKKLTLFLLFLFVAGFLIRGPMGLVVPVLVACTYYLLEKNYREFFTIAASSVLLLISCSILQLFIAQQTEGIFFAKQVFFMEVGGRLAHLGQRPFYYYLINSLGGYALAFPMAIVTLCAYGKRLFTQTHKAELHLLKHVSGWAFIVLLVLSFPHEKHFRYIISAAPAFALIASYGFIAAADNSLLLVSRKILLKGFQLLPFLGIILLSCSFYFQDSFGKAFLGYRLPALIIFCVLALAIFYCQRKLAEQDVRELSCFGIGIITLLTLFICVAQPLAEQYITSVKPLLDKISGTLQPQQNVVFYQVNPDREGLKFAVLLPNPTGSFLTTPEQLTFYKKPAIFVASQKSFNDLSTNLQSHCRILWQEKVARNNWVVFTYNGDSSIS